jgi:signal transduction histidine kinase
LGVRSRDSLGPALRLRIVLWGFIGSIVLVLLCTVVSIFEVARAQKDVLHLFREGERTTHIIGHVGTSLARAQLILRESLSERPDDPYMRLELPRILDSISADARDLGPLLSPAEQVKWTELQPEIDRLRQQMLLSFQAFDAGDLEKADRILDSLLPATVLTYEHLSQLAKQNREEIASLLGRADRRLSIVRAIELLLGLSLLAGVAAAWIFVIRTLHRQHHQIAEHVRTIETARADLDAFAGRVAHDLRNALAPLFLAVERFERSANDPETVGLVLKRLKTVGTRGMALLDAMLAFSRGQIIDPNVTSVLRHEVDNCLQELRPLAEKVGATVDVSVQGEPVARISPALLRIVLTNIVGNALKYLAQSPQKEVSVSVRVDGEHCVLTVKDTGPGIPETSLPRVFDPFYRVPGTQAAGTGIGLATVQRIVDAHHGSIAVFSPPGQGACFEVSLPAADIELSQVLCSISGGDAKKRLSSGSFQRS